MNRAKRIEIYSRLRKKMPNPETELVYDSPFELLIAWADRITAISN